MKAISLLLALPLLLAAQQSEYTYVFQITADEAQTLYQYQGEDLYSDPFLYQMVDSFENSIPVLATGHYLLVKAANEGLNIQQHSVHQYGVQQIADGNYLRIGVRNTHGMVAPDGRLLFDEELIPWQASIQSYRTKRPRENGWLRIEMPGDTLFYQVAYNKIKPQRRRFLRTPIGYFISTPYRFAKNTYRYFKRGIGRGNWHLNWRRIWPFPKKDRTLKGYIALSQPRYRPGDTLRLKTYLTKRNGRPFRKPIQLTMNGYRYQQVINRELQPDRAGAFTTEIVLADSLKLDQTYSLYFSVLGKNKYGRKSASFHLEDYQLDAATFELDLSQKQYRPDEPILITASGQDKNGNPLPGAAVELVALRQHVTDIEPDSLMIPDTLWTFQQDLSLREDTKIRFPDSLLYPANMGIKIEAFFSTAGGEAAQKNTSFFYHYQSGKLAHSLQRGQWKFTYEEADSSISQTATLKTQHSIPPFSTTQTITLPHQEKLDPFITNYLLETSKNLRYSVNPSQEASGVEILGQHTGDSLLLHVANPHGLNITYQLYEGSKHIAEGSLRQDSLLEISAQAKKKYQIDIQYTWAGAPRTKSQTFQSFARQLQFSADLPDKIIPGQTVQVKIQATDQKDRPAKGVEMVAGAVNAQFNSLQNLSPPQVTYKVRKGYKQRHQFSLHAVSNQHITSISPHWYQRFALDTMLYYKIRYPERGIFEQQDTILADSFYLQNPQISPYLVENHKLQPIYLIYLNRELVYSHYSQDDRPYAFNARPGYNQIRIRTLDAEYRIDSVFVKAGHKLSLALDAKNFGVHPVYGSRIKRTTTKKYLSPGEKDLLNLKMIRIRKEERQSISYLYSDSTQIYQWNNPYSNANAKVIGPVPANQHLTYLQRDGLKNRFFYEPGYIYEIRANRERLYSTPFLLTKNQYDLPAALPHPPVDQIALRPSDIVEVSPKRKKIIFRKGWNSSLDGGHLQILYGQENDSTLVAVSLQNVNGEYSIYRPTDRYFARLPQGYYELTLITPTGNTAQRKCWIYPHQLQVLDFRGIAFEQDTSFDLFKELYTYELVKPSFLTYQSQGSTPPANNRYQDVGYLAQGTLTDDNGEPLMFANVLLAGTNIGTMTDINGRYAIWVPDANAILQFSYLGYSTQQVKAGDIGEQLTLSDSGMALDEVVVTSYRVPLVEQDNTTQGATLTSDQIQRLPTRNINALAATTAGISVADSDQINVRGSRDAATSYYVDGVRVSATVPGAELLLSGSGLRTEFRDYGFWVTDLITDNKGEAYFQVTFPDDITQWKTFVLGMDDRKRAGAWYGETAAFKPVLAQLYLPRFLLPGDQIELVGSSVNYTNDTFQISTQLEVEGVSLLKEEHQLVDGITDEVSYTAQEGRDSLTAKYTLQTGNYQDGEERSIPIFKVGTEETIGAFHRLQGDTTIELSFPPEDGPVTIYAQPDMLHVMLEEIEALIHYPYGCNEQSASRLLALLMYKEIQEAIGQPFTEEEAIQKMVALLRQRQRPDGSWGWWGGSPQNQWMTIYVVRALHAAKEAGYETEALEKGLIFLTNQLSSLRGTSRLEAIALFSEIGQNMDYEALLTPYDTLPYLNWTTLTTTLIKAQQGLPFQLDTLAKYRQETLFGGHYWGQEGYGFYQNYHQYNLLAYRTYRAAGETEALAPIRQFFLEQRHRSPGYHWRAGYRNTFEAALILRTIIPDLLENHQQDSALNFKQQVVIQGQENIVWDTFPKQVTIDAGQAIRIQKTGIGQTFLTAYQQRWNPQPERVEGPFVVTSSLWQGNKATDQLAQSRPAFLKVELTVENATDYLLLEVPIPAGCSYGSKQRSRGYTETYREYLRNKVAIFCEHLEPGEYSYYIELEPRFTGQFQLNPAKAEQMYFPVFYGREGMKRVGIE
ncbi:carboxypeptidase-like regulatory domain-containing protein [Lewinella cohaerens]|uniref:carboxypeptidase-like regulatory domain-containing protein n=1 Tax=Lewinella cohaerens TaxID=70995 RepID=UPI000367CD4C|nr:carboxypeptidase-like regulatory domain-containing protein [Lewinella cohaerens]